MRTTRGAAIGIGRLANRVRNEWRILLQQTLGQDLIEYALVVGMVTVIIGAMLPGQVLPPLRQLWILIAAPLNWASGASS